MMAIGIKGSSSCTKGTLMGRKWFKQTNKSDSFAPPKNSSKLN
jgi:hypothetical protein